MDSAIESLMETLPRNRSSCGSSPLFLYQNCTPLRTYVVCIKMVGSVRSPLCYTRLSPITSAVEVDDEGQILKVEVPLCLIGTAAAMSLVHRLLQDDWTFHHPKDIICEAWSRPTPPATVKRIARRMCLIKEPLRHCVICGVSTRFKCEACQDVYYCSVPCQRKHWPQHRLQCKALPVAEHCCIAVPDYRCFFQYQHAMAQKADTLNHVPIMVMSRVGFASMFGDEAVEKTIRAFVVTGKPEVFMAETFEDSEKPI